MATQACVEPAWAGLGVGGTLTQSAADGVLFDGVFWLGVIVITALLGAVMLGYLKNRVRTFGQAQGVDFTLEDLRRLRDGGALTTAEYEKLKRRLVSDPRHRSATATDDGVHGTGPR